MKIKKDVSWRHVAFLAGLQLSHRDGTGRLRTVSQKVLEKILEAMGLPADGAGAVSALVRRMEKGWKRVVDPVQVHCATAGPLAVSVALPDKFSRAPYRYRLILEDGSRHAGGGRVWDWPVQSTALIDGKPWVRRTFLFHVPLFEGYHRLEIELDWEGASKEWTQQVIAVPETAYLPESLHGDGRVWGVAVQLYGVRSRTNWGIGDFTDLKRLIVWAARQGAAFVGINPLDLLFPEAPDKVSPYSPSSRRFLQPWYLDVPAIPEFQEIRAQGGLKMVQENEEFLARLRNEPLVPYEEAWKFKRRVLEELFQWFWTEHWTRDDERGRDYRAYLREKGETLRLYGVFQALVDHFRELEPSLWGWPVWPEPYRDPESREVFRFAQEHEKRVHFHMYCAWNADRQWSSCGRTSLEHGLGVGLYGDFPVGVDPAGFDCWLEPDLYASSVRLGAPPDEFNVNGQEWGVVPFLPDRLRVAAYGPFIELLRSHMKEAGALRIDHVMGLMRLYWVPIGMCPVDGAYVHYPFYDLLGIVALESRRNRCMVVGEDLGTVPEGLREVLERKRIFGCRLCLFEKNPDGSFRNAEDYPPLSLASFATHDLPTLEGFWEGRDLEIRSRLKLFPGEEARKRAWETRRRDGEELLKRVGKQGVERERREARESAPEEIPKDQRAAAVYRFLGRAGSKMVAVSMEDLLGVADPVNVPGTVDEHPNWRRKAPCNLEDLEHHPRVRRILDALREARSERST